MNYPRVNLIKKSERRYQGIVSRSFILLVGIGAPVLLILLIAGLSAVNVLSTESQLKSTRNLWENYEPQLEDYRRQKAVLASSKKMVELFRGWEESQTSMEGLLSEMQRCVPENIQFTKLSVLSDNKESLFLTPQELRLGYDLIIDGVAVGQEAEDDVIALQKELQGGDLMAAAFSTLKLGSMRKGLQAEGQALRQFRLMGASEKGEK